MTTVAATPIAELAKEECIRTEKKSLFDYVEAGQTAINAGDVQSALTHFKTAVTMYPLSPEGHNNLGAMHSSLGQFKQAEYCFDKVLEILPKNANILYNRGIVRSHQEKFDLAREDFLAVTKINPTDPDNFNNLGVMAFMQGHLSVARKHLKKALKLNPGYANALINLCDVEVQDGNLNRAVTLCEHFLKDNHDLEIRRKHLDLLSQNCQISLDKASKMAEKLLVLEKDNKETRTQLGKLTQAKAALLDGPSFL